MSSFGIKKDKLVNPTTNDDITQVLITLKNNKVISIEEKTYTDKGAEKKVYEVEE